MNAPRAMMMMMMIGKGLGFASCFIHVLLTWIHLGPTGHLGVMWGSCRLAGASKRVPKDAQGFFEATNRTIPCISFHLALHFVLLHGFVWKWATPRFDGSWMFMIIFPTMAINSGVLCLDGFPGLPFPCGTANAGTPLLFPRTDFSLGSMSHMWLSRAAEFPFPSGVQKNLGSTTTGWSVDSVAERQAHWR